MDRNVSVCALQFFDWEGGYVDLSYLTKTRWALVRDEEYDGSLEHRPRFGPSMCPCHTTPENQARLRSQDPLQHIIHHC